MVCEVGLQTIYLQHTLMTKIKIEYVQLSKLTAHEKNSKTHPDSQLEELAESIKLFGFNKPIITDEYNVILAGHGIWMAALKAGIKEGPRVKLTHLSDREKRAFIIADNKLAEKSRWDFNMLAEEINALVELEAPITVLGFNEQELDALLKSDVSIFPEEHETFSRKSLLKPDTGVKKIQSKLVHTCPECGHKFHA